MIRYGIKNPPENIRKNVFVTWKEWYMLMLTKKVCCWYLYRNKDLFDTYVFVFVFYIVPACRFTASIACSFQILKQCDLYLKKYFKNILEGERMLGLGQFYFLKTNTNYYSEWVVDNSREALLIFKSHKCQTLVLCLPIKICRYTNHV